MTFRYYTKDVYGAPLKYPADEESREMLWHVRGGKTATGGDLECLKFFGVNSEEVLRPRV